MRKHFVVQERCQFVGTSLLLRDCYCYRATSVCKTPWGTRIIPHVLQFGSGTRFPYLLDLAESSHNPGRRKSVISMESMDLRGCESLGKGFLPPSPLIPGQGITSLKNCLHSLLGFIHCVVSEGLWGLDFLSPWIPVGLG